MSTQEIAKRLSAPFPPGSVSWRVGSTNTEKTRGMALAFIDARDVQERLDDVLGPFGWASNHEIVGDRTICRLSIRNPENGEWVTRSDGAGDTDYEAEKGAFSSALKRAAVNFGVGRYLYGLASPWVEIETRGKSYIIPDREMPKLRALLARGVETSQRPARAPSPPPAPNGAGARETLQTRLGARGKDHPRYEEALGMKDQFKALIQVAPLPKVIDDIFVQNRDAIELIHEVSPSWWEALVQLGADRKIALFAETA